ncbi:MAG: hypothetical protein IPK03_11685 [Bacteroidetes bacterium]|nr:hypothetical protein [Bacteroidota bacterium]
MKIGYLVLILFCFTACTKKNSSNEIIGYYNITMLSIYADANTIPITDTLIQLGTLEISLTESSNKYLITFDKNIKFWYQDSLIVYDEELLDNKMYIKRDEDRQIDAKIFNTFNNVFTNIDCEISNSIFYLYYKNESFRDKKIQYLVTGKKI